MSSAQARLRAVVGETAAVPQLRETRWIAVGDTYVAFIADDAGAWARLSAEGALLGIWRDADIPAPLVLEEVPGLRVQIRARLDGLTGAAIEPLIFGRPNVPDRYAPDVPLTEFGRTLAGSYGELAAQMHDALTIDSAVARALGPKVPIDLEACGARILRWAPTLLGAFEEVRERLMNQPGADVVVHGDLHFHNMVLAEDGRILGVFDVGDAGIAHAASELQYAHSLGPRFVEHALRAYSRCRAPVDEEEVLCAHLRSALGHLLWFPPESPRHKGILRWIEGALSCGSARSLALQRPWATVGKEC